MAIIQMVWSKKRARLISGTKRHMKIYKLLSFNLAEAQPDCCNQAKAVYPNDFFFLVDCGWLG